MTLKLTTALPSYSRLSDRTSIVSEIGAMTGFEALWDVQLRAPQVTAGAVTSLLPAAGSLAFDIANGAASGRTFVNDALDGAPALLFDGSGATAANLTVSGWPTFDAANGFTWAGVYRIVEPDRTIAFNFGGWGSGNAAATGFGYGGSATGSPYQIKRAGTGTRSIGDHNQWRGFIYTWQADGTGRIWDRELGFRAFQGSSGAFLNSTGTGITMTSKSLWIGTNTLTRAAAWRGMLTFNRSLWGDDAALAKVNAWIDLRTGRY